ncbi:MAG: ABC transporter substrate-binding protein [Kiritimatiellae bacterium]|nr:ABC transporter substrate-binding protein [Kiritimatiellia bacterium]
MKQVPYARRLLPLVGLLLLSGTLALKAAPADTQPIVFVPQWEPQAQFAGYYVAVEKGFYTRSGLTVTILRGGPNQPVGRLLQEGQADFATTFLASALEKRSRDGLPLVNIAQMVQRSSLLLVARKSSGIHSPADLQGKTVSLWPDFAVQPKALFRKFGVEPRVLTQGATINLFLRGAVDAASGMWYNEYHMLINGGLEAQDLTFFFYDQFGLNFPEDGIYCLAPTLKQNPDRCRRFVQASIAGWQYAFQHPEEALDIVMRQVTAANRPTNRVHQRWMLSRMKDIMQPPGAPAFGTLAESDYSRVAQELKDAGQINAIPAWNDFYENCAISIPTNQPGR